MPEPTPDTTDVPLSDAAVGAVVALLRVGELYDAAVAHRAALRATVAALLVDQISGRAEPSTTIAAAALADVELVVERPEDPEAHVVQRSSMLGATLVSRLPGLGAVTRILELTGRQERPDDDATTSAGQLAARVVAVADAVVGNPAEGYLPTWDHALRRCERLAGEGLDPDLCDLLHDVDLSGVEVPVSPSDRLHRLLSEAVEHRAAHNRSAIDEPDDDADIAFDTASDVPGALADPSSEVEDRTTATTIKSAVAAAGDAADVVGLFAASAQRIVDAAEVVILQMTPTELDIDPIAQATDGLQPELPRGHLEELREFTTNAELRAGATLERPTPERPREVVLPIVVAEETWGVMVASRRDAQPPFDAHDSSVLRHIASEAADAVASTSHWAQMERMALRDQLTGLANRHELYRVLDGIFARPPLERVDCALIMCDVDGLKIVNDTLGHQAGDRLLIDAASALRGAVRDPERTTICRIGGDEFCLVIDGGALLTAHDVSDTIERLFARSAGSGPPRSISCGIAFASEDIQSRSALLRAADENQYQTKRARKAEREALAQQVEAAGEGPPVDRRAIRD